MFMEKSEQFFFPRILFITPCAFNSITGGGITFSNLFRGWPKEKLATITDDPIPVSRDICSRYYFLSSQERTYIAPFSWVRGDRDRRQEKPSEDQRRVPSLPFRMGKRLLGDAGIPDKGILGEELENWIRVFHPDLIYTILGTTGYIELVEKIQEAFRLPVAVHLMDDGVTDPKRKGLFGAYIRRTYAKRFRSLLSKTSVRMAICEDMAEVYADRYRLPFIHFQNAIDVRSWMERFSQKDCSLRSPARILYIGSVVPYAQMESLRDCCKAVRKLNEAGHSITLTIHTQKALLKPEAFEAELSPNIRVQDAPRNDDDLFRMMSEADVLILPANFDRESIHFIRLSMPTKIPVYLASGIPILVYGPEGVSQVEYARKHGWGYIVDRRDQDALTKVLMLLIQDMNLRTRLSAAAQRTAMERHDAAKVRVEFQKTLSSIVKIDRS
jgi:glycosyltransferase involved in cell wall biosynthesis